MTPPVALTCGEPAGIGPEIAVKAWITLGSNIPFFWIGDPRHLPDGTPFQVIERPEETEQTCKAAFPVIAHPFPEAAAPGRPSAANAKEVVNVIERAVDLFRSGAASALTTCPISKKALIDGAGFGFPGHTEYLAALAENPPVAMMLVCDALKIVPATIHIPLSDVSKALTPELLFQILRTTHKALRSDFGIPEPRIAVAGLNPHAGEGGAIGKEELKVVGPVLETLRAEGMDLSGPRPADTMFHSAARAAYDAAVAMYHDQALIPIKTIDFSGGVNVTLGLPFVRTSPDHGTAFDIAGQGVADPTSLIAALKMAQEIATRRKRDG
jgi:4-hydroxythreonine-4-phosphate dehydrogenase